MITAKNSRYFLWLPITGVLFLIFQANFLLYHALAETFSIVIACSIFIIAWNSRKFSNQPYLLFIGIGYLFVAILDITHTFAYKGFSIFSGYDSNLPTQFWISARYLQSITFLCAAFFFKRKFNLVAVFCGYILVVVLVFASIFWWAIFPDCFMGETGLTAFKKVSEYIICLFWGLAIYVLAGRRTEIDGHVFTLLVASMGVSIASELTFTLYADVSGIANFLGHFFKILSFYFVYKASIVTNLTQPYMSMFRDLKLNEMRFRSIYNTAPLAFVVWGANCRITDWNTTAEKIFGWSADEVLGRDFLEFLIPEKDRGHVEDVIESLLQGTFVNRSINENLTRDGRIIVCDWNNSVILNEKGSPCMVLSLALDITDKIQAEKALEKSSENIKRFAYSVVHDLKSPTASLHGLAYLLAKRYGNVMDSKAKSFCDQIMRIAEQVSVLVENINIYIATKEIPFRIETIDVKAILTLVREEFSSQIISREIQWEEPESIPSIQADRIAISRVFRNYIDNALKYGGEQLGEIRIGYTDDEAHHILSVTDDGNGLLEENIENIFDAFNRTGNTTNITGSGLGLAIVKEIAEKLGGEVWAESASGMGATFFMSVSKRLN